MKKIITFICALVAVIAVTSCDVESSTTIVFENLPKTVYEAKEYSETELDALLAEITVKIDDTSVNLKDSSLKVTGFDLNTLKTPGDYTLIVKYGSASVAFGYTVVQLQETILEANDEASLRQAVEKGGVIKLTADITLENKISIEKSIVIYGEDHFIQTDNGRLFVLDNVSNLKVAMYDVDLIGSEKVDGARAVSLFNTSNIELTFENCMLTSGAYTFNLASYNINNSISFKKCVIEGYAAINVWANSTTITVEDSELISNWDLTSQTFGVIVIEGGNVDPDGLGLQPGETGQDNDIIVKNSTISCANPSASVYVLLTHNACANNEINFYNVTLNYDGQKLYLPDDVVPAANKFYIDGVRQ